MEFVQMVMFLTTAAKKYKLLNSNLRWVRYPALQTVSGFIHYATVI